MESSIATILTIIQKGRFPAGPTILLVEPSSPGPEKIPAPPDGPRPMEVHRSAQTALCEFQGRILDESLPGLNCQLEELLKEGVKLLIIKLGPSLVLNSSALGMLLNLNAKADALGVRFAVIAPEGEVRRVLSRTRLDDLLDILSEQEATALSAQFSLE